MNTATKCKRHMLRAVGEQVQYWYVDENGNEETPCDDGDFEMDHYECRGCDRYFEKYDEALKHYGST